MSHRANAAIGRRSACRASPALSCASSLRRVARERARRGFDRVRASRRTRRSFDLTIQRATRGGGSPRTDTRRHAAIDAAMPYAPAKRL
ncbi:hypothetical protein C7S16_2551 [Burkholderia thailandensis]|uniref:Uncharacterized protein n=1 Tax=Burkholderia thailandensis TaxID=57975 RepID=A0AAW9D6H3_BURTH|nr:hypothetical protein [Burkholderia thailandensis]MDW9257543.1 hypothetical protein [Burkholderia thailandensis]